jgi:multidrug efflux system membrane fusion protein
MSAEIVLHADAVAAVTVPRSVVTIADTGVLGIRVVAEDGSVGFVPVDVVDDTPDGLVLRGVPAGADVIISGQDLVRNGEMVRTERATSVDPAASTTETP